MSTKTKPVPMTTSEAAESLCVSERTILNLIHAGRLVAYRPGVGKRGKFVIDADEVERYRRACRFGASEPGAVDHLSRRGRRP